MDAERAAQVLAPPAQRSRARADKAAAPKPPSQQSLAKPATDPVPVPEQATETPTPATPAAKSAPATPAPVQKAKETPRPPAKPIQPSGPVDTARARLAARTAEQTFLPLVSRIAKLNDWIGQARMAVTDAKSAGVLGEHLEDTLRGIARKNGTSYTDIPESVRVTIADESSTTEPSNEARARLAARTAEQTFLPLVSRIAKLRDWVQQAELAIQDAKTSGVDAEHLEDTLRGIARKNGITYTDIPESVRATIAAD